MSTEATVSVKSFLDQGVDLENLDRFREVVYASPENEKEAVELAQKLDDPYERGVTLAVLGNRQAAFTQLEKAHPKKEAATYCLAQMLLDDGRLEPAERILREGLKRSPDSAPLACALGRAVLRQPERFEEAERILDEITKRFHEDADVLALRGEFEEVRGDYKQARQTYEEVLEKRPRDVRILFALARYHNTYGDLEKAREVLERARELHPGWPNLLVNLGTLYEDEGMYDEAVSCYREVLKRIPNHRRASMFLQDAEASKRQYYDEDLERKADRRSQILRIPVTDFELSVRSRNCLNKMNIKTLGDLVQMTEAELLAHKNFGETSLAEVKQMLAQKGLRLGMGKMDRLTFDPQKEPDISDEVLKRPIADLDLSVRSRNCVEKLNIQTIGDLVAKTESELLQTKNFGQTSLNEVKGKLGELGLGLSSSE